MVVACLNCDGIGMDLLNRKCDTCDGKGFMDRDDCADFDEYEDQHGYPCACSACSCTATVTFRNDKCGMCSEACFGDVMDY